MNKILLRTMTKKSCVGFGKFKTITVGDMLNLGNYEGLVSIYYNLELCTFDKEVLEILNITGDLVIAKPGVDKQKFEKYSGELVRQLREIHGMRDFSEQATGQPPLLFSAKKRANAIRRVKEVSKQLNMNRNRKPKK